MKKIKAILIGLGNIGFSCDLNKAKTFYSHSKVLNKLDFIDFVCGVDKDKKKLLEFKKIYKIDTSSNLEKSILKISKIGVLGYHPSFLPFNKGRHPLIWAKVLGLKKTGSTFFFHG